MAKPTDPIKTSLDVAGLVSGLHLHNDDGGIRDSSMIDDNLVRWANWRRLGYAIAGSFPEKAVPPSDAGLRKLIESHPQN